MQCCMPSYVCGCPGVGEYTIWFSLRGGGVYAFIFANILYTNEDLEDAAFECMWLWLWPFRLPKLTVILTNRQIPLYNAGTEGSCGVHYR